MSANTKIQQFVTQQKRLLTLELHADQDEAADINTQGDGGSGFFLRNVDVIETSVGLYGRTVVSFGQNENNAVGSNSNESSKSSRCSLLDAHRLTVGDEIEILPKNGKVSKRYNAKRVGGVVCAVDDHSISIALEDRKRHHHNNDKKHSSKQGGNEEDLDEDSDMLGGSSPYTLVPRSGVEVHHKMIASLDELEKYGVDHPIAGDVILSAFEPSHIPIGAAPMTAANIDELEKEYNLANTKLDYSQKEAVVFALNSHYPISLIHGPPGTGKTTTVAELIRCAVNIKNWKILVTAPSNVAVDNILERMIGLENENSQKCGKRKNSKKKNSPRIIPCRLGHPSRIQQSIQKYSLESLVQSSEGTEIVQDCRRELNTHLRTLSNPKSRPSEKRVAYSEMKSLRKEIRQREEKVVGEILRHANVVLATNVGAAGSVFKRMVDIKGEPISFDLVIIDEAAQALEASCWISLLRGNRAVLAGDHCQLPPTIKCSNREVQIELGRTLFERLMRTYDGGKNEATCKPSKMLKVQYRMHEDIADWASNAVYDGKLISYDSVKYRKLSSLPQVQEQLRSKELNKDIDDPAAALQNNTLKLIDTAGCGFNEMKTDAGSRYNEGEAELVIAHVWSLLALGLRAEDIAVITPYNGQVELLRKRLLIDVPKLEIRSVDGFQGGEREAVVLSLVRSSQRGGKDGIGFLRDERRLNVAVTRAKRHLALICDCETVSQNRFIKGLIEWVEEKGDYCSGAELVNSTPGETVTYAAPPQKNNQLKPTNIAEKVEPIVQTKITSTSQKSSKGDLPEESTKSSESQDCLKEGARRRALMNKVSQFAETQPKGNELVLRDLQDFDIVVIRELASQLGLRCDNTMNCNNSLTLCIVKSACNKDTAITSPDLTDNTRDKIIPSFSHLDLSDDDDSSKDLQADVSSNSAQNSLLKDLALERQQRQMTQQKPPPNTSIQSKAKKSKKKKGKKLGGETKQVQESNDDILDDMDFLDAQIESIQTSHGRKIEAKGKGYKSIINGVLLSKNERPEVKKTNTAAGKTLHAKIKAKSQDRQVKKKQSK